MHPVALSRTIDSDFWSPNGASSRLLVVDDDEVTLNLMGTILADAGFAVETATTAADALVRLERQPADVVVLDLMLADVDGRETCREIRTRFGRSIGILMVSARGRLAVATTLEAGADDFLAKPFEVDELEARVRALLRSRAFEAAARRRSDRLVSLQRISAAIASRLSEPEMIDLVLQEARRLLDASSVVLYLLTPEDGRLHPAHQVGEVRPPPLAARRPGEGIVGRVFDERQPRVVADYPNWDDATQEGLASGLRAAVAAPILHGDRPIGVIVARSTASERSFDEEDAQLLELLASHAAVAFTNARLYAAQQAVAARAAHRAAELEAVLESMVEGVLLVDARRTITSANRAAAAILGKGEIAVGKVSLDAVLADFRPATPPEDAASDPRLHAEQAGADAPSAVQLGQIGELELEGAVDGRLRRLSVTSCPVGDGAAGMLLVLRDVTDQRLLEERQAQAEKLRTLGQLASGVAHGVNNVLAAILGRTELARLEIERSQLQPERVADALRLIEQAAEDGAQMVRRIQELAQPPLDHDASVVDLATVIRDVLELTRPRWQASAAPIDVRVDVDRALWVKVAPAELREVFTNLVLNAIDAMPDGGQLMLTARRELGTARVKVSDTGVGMPPEVSRRVFEPFFTTKAAGGTGLGLAIASGIVRRRGGEMLIESEVDRGTTVTLVLPPAEPDDARSSHVDQTGEPQLISPGGSILVVDDDPSLAQLLQRVLEAHDYRVTTCTSAFEALRRFNPDEFDLVISDYAMPGANGVELAAALRARSPTTPVLLMTAWGSGLDFDDVPPDIAGVVSKPYRLAEVIQAVDDALAQGGASAPESAPGGSQDRARSG